MFDYSNIPFNLGLLLKQIESRGGELSRIHETNVIEARIGNHVEYIYNCISSLNPAVYMPIFLNKNTAKSLLRSKGIVTLPGKTFTCDEFALAADFAELIKYPVVVKPLDLSNGDFVFIDIVNKNDLYFALETIKNAAVTDRIMVEKYFNGDDCRFFVIDNGDIGVVRRVPPAIMGDGKSTIRELINAENYRRMNPRDTCLCEIYIDDPEGQRSLMKQGLTESSILEENRVIQLRFNGNVSTGATCENIIDQIHPSYLQLARYIHSLFPGNPYTSVDLLLNDITSPASQSNYAFCEINPAPGFSLHLMPSKGEPFDVVTPLVDRLFPETISGL